MSRFALVDDRLVEDSLFLRRGLGQPTLKTPQPILRQVEALGSVLRDDQGRWRMWYMQPIHRDPAVAVVGMDCMECLAYSNDGLNWQYPQLGLVEEGASKANNIILGSRQKDATGRYLTGYGGMSGFCVIDSTTHPHPAARARFTAMGTVFPVDTIGGICLYSSDDGLHWLAYPENPVIVGSQDTQNCFFYDNRTQRYVCYQRPTIYCGVQWHANRKMARLESTDLVHWSRSRVMLDTDELDAPGMEPIDEPGMPHARGRSKQFQGMTPFPWGDGYLALTWMYDSKVGVFQLEMIRSHDNRLWLREALRQPLIADGLPAGFTGKLAVPMGSPPVEVGDEMWMYVSNTPYGHHEVAQSEFSQDREHAKKMLETGALYCIALKRDRWVGYEAGAREGELLSTPLDWAGGGPLQLNAQVAAGGKITVEFEDQWARPVRDFHLDEIAPITGPCDSVEIPVVFGPGPKTLCKFPPIGPIRLRFRLQNATLYGWRCGGLPARALETT